MTRKTAFLKGWSWFKFNNLGLALGTKLKFYTNVAKGLNLKVREFCWLIPTFLEVTGGKLVEEGGEVFWPPTILNRVKPQLRKSYRKSYIYVTCLFSYFYTQLYSIKITLFTTAFINCWFFSNSNSTGRERRVCGGSFFFKNGNVLKVRFLLCMYEQGRSGRLQKSAILCKRNN